MKSYDSIKDLICDIDTELTEIALHDIKLFIKISDLLIERKLWDGETVVSKYTSLLYGNNYNPRDFTYDLRPEYINNLEELKDLTKNKSLKSELQVTIDECERIQMGGMC